MNEQEKIIKKKLEFFKNQKVAVHISKKNEWFHNGKILEIQGDLIILDDEKNGAMPIYFEEIKDIEKKRDDNENSKGGQDE